MKRILLLFSVQSRLHKLAEPERLTELLNDTSRAQFEFAYFNDLSFYLDNNEASFIDEVSGKHLDDYDAIYIRHWGIPESQGHGLAIARYCKLKNIPFIDREVWRVGSLNKLTQYINLFEAVVSFPKTFMADARHIATGLERYGFSYPFILKAAQASRGENNFLVKSEAQLQAIVNEQPDTAFVLQEYIENNGDYRVLVCGDKVELIIRRTAAGDTHLNNTSQGGNAEIVDANVLPPRALDDCIKAAKFFGRDFAGVDIVLDAKGNHYCFEVNRAPQVENSSFEQEKAAILSKFLVELASDK